jgi:uncharacterized repeat protein (TIGR01451 family)
MNASGGAGGSGVVIIRYLPSNLRITQQASEFIQSGLAFDVPAQVQVRSNANLANNPDTGIPNVQVTATLESGTGTLANNVVTTDANGFATFTNLTITGVPGIYYLRFTVAGGANNYVISEPIEIREPSQFFWEIVHPPAYPLCVQSVPITFTIKDQYGNIDTDYQGTVLVNNSGSAGSYAVAVGQGSLNVVGPGVVEYPITSADNGTFTLDFSTSTIETLTFNASSDGGNILRDPDYASSMQVDECTLRIEHDGTGGTCAANPITIRVIDVLGNNVVDYSGTVTLNAIKTNNPNAGASGSWTNLFGGSGTLTNTATGNATYAFAPGSGGDGGEVSLGYNNTASGTFTFSASGTNSGPGTNAVSSTSFNAGTLTIGSCYFKISHDGSNGVCAPAEILIEVFDNNNNLVTGFSGLIALSTQGNTRGNWSKTDVSNPNYANGTLTPGAPDTGAATYQFVSADGGRINLNFSIDEAANINFNIAATGVSAPTGSNDPTMSFTSCQFRITHSGSSDLCSIEQVTIALYNGSNPVTNYTGTINLSTSTGFGSWEGSLTSEGVLVDPVNEDGSATYQFDINDEGQVVLNFRHSSDIGPVNINVSDGISQDARNSADAFDLNINYSLCSVRISHQVNNNACAITPVTFAVYDSNDQLATDYVGTLRITTSINRGDWLEGAGVVGNLTAPSGSDVGVADFEFVAGDNGSVILGFLSGVTGTINFDAVDGLIVESGAFDPNLELTGCFPQVSSGPVCTNPAGPGPQVTGNTLSLTIDGQNPVPELQSRIVLVSTMQIGVSSENGTNVTFDGSNMTRLYRQYNATSPGVTTEVWAMLESDLPANAGSYNAVFTGGVGTPSFCVLAATGIAQTLPQPDPGNPSLGQVNGSNLSAAPVSGRHDVQTNVTSIANNSFVFSAVTNDRAANTDLNQYYFGPAQPFTAASGIWGGPLVTVPEPRREGTVQGNPSGGKSAGSAGVLSTIGLLELVEPFFAPTSPPSVSSHVVAVFEPLVAGAPRASNYEPVILYETYAGSMSYRAIDASLRTDPSPANLTVDPTVDCAMVDFATGTTASLSIPAGATLTAAYLYWAGSGTLAQADTEVTFGLSTEPGSTVVAEQLFMATGLTTAVADFFGAYAEVSSLITDLDADYTLKNLTVQTGAPWSSNGTCAGGWSLIAIYEHPNEQLRVVNLFHGFQPFQYGAFTLTPRNFRMATYTPQFNLPNGQVTHFTIEGDEQLFTGDESLQIQSAPNATTFTEIPNSFNPPGSEFNSTITHPIYALRELPVQGDTFVFDPIDDGTFSYPVTPAGINGDGYEIDVPGVDALQSTRTGNRIGASWGVDIDTHYLSDQLLQPFALAPNEAERITTRYSSGQDMVILVSEVISITNFPLADIEVFITQSGDFKVGGTGSYQIEVANNGNGPNTTGGSEATGEVRVAMTLPAGMTFAAASSVDGGTDWNCDVSLGVVNAGVVTTPGALTCVYVGLTPFDPQTSLPDITANVVVGNALNFPLQNNSATAVARVQHTGGACPVAPIGLLPDQDDCNRAPQFDNRNDLQGGAIDINTLVQKTNNNNNVDSIVTTVQGLRTDLRMQKTLNGNLEAGSETAQYTLTVTNLGPDVTNQTITVTDAQPAGLLFTAASGTGWNCSSISPTLTCTYAGSLAVNSSASITLTATVTGGIGFNVTNTAVVDSGPNNFDVVPSNDSATVISTIIGPPVSSQERFLLSVHVPADGTTSIGDPEVGRVENFTNHDLIIYDPLTDEAVMFFDDSASNAGRINDIDAVHLLKNGHILMSAASNSIIGSNNVSFGASDLVRYDPILGTAKLFLDGAQTVFLNHTPQNITSAYVLQDCDPNLPSTTAYMEQCSVLFSTENGGVAGTNNLSFTSSDIVIYHRSGANAGQAFIYLEGSDANVFGTDDGNGVIDVDAYYQRVDETDDLAVISQHVLSVDNETAVIGAGGTMDPTTGTLFGRDDVVGLNLVDNESAALFVGDQPLGVFEPTDNDRRIDALHVVEDGYFGHFSIVQDQSGNVCEAGVFRISKHKGLTHLLDEDYYGTVLIETSTNYGTWQLQGGQGTFTNLGNGQARYTFVPADNGEVTLRLEYDQVAVVNVNVTNGIAREIASEDPNFNVNELLTPIAYTDYFDTTLLSNSDGNLNWTASWVEVDGVTGVGTGGGLTTGNIQVVNNRLRMGSNPTTVSAGVIPSMSRVVNLAQGTGAGEIPYTTDVILQANVSHTAITTSDSFVIEARGSSSDSFVVLENFNTTLPDTSNSSELKQYNLSTSLGQALTDTAEIRFRILAGFEADNRYFYINDVSVKTDTNVCGYSASSDLDHYAISHPGAGIACVGTPVTISAHDGAHGLIDAGGETIQLSVSQGRGIWARVLSGNPGGLTPLANQLNNGTASYTFPPGDSQVTLLLNYPVDTGDTASVNINVLGTVTNATEVSGEDPLLQISDAGLQFYNETAGTGVSPIPTQIAGKPSNQWLTDHVISLRAVRSSDNNPFQCVPLFDDAQTLEIEFAAECQNPNTCTDNIDPQDPEVFSINGTSVVLHDDNGTDAATLPYTPVQLTFDVPNPGDAPRANLSLNYSDVGLMQLHARFNIPFGYFEGSSPDNPLSPPVTGFSGGGFSNNYMTGSSNSFVVRPFGFVIDFPGINALDRATGLQPGNFADRGPDSDIPANSCAGLIDVCNDGNSSDSVFVYAGEGFDTVVAAVGWQAADDQNQDGLPDYAVDNLDAQIRSAANLHDNRVAPNFLRDSFGQSAFGDYRVDLSVIYNEAESVGGIRADDELMNNQFGKSDFAASGYGTRNMQYHEAGIIDLQAQLVNNVAGVGRPAIGEPIDYVRMLLGQDLTDINDDPVIDAPIVGRVLNVGRFYPARFEVTATMLLSRSDLSCTPESSFTYMDESFEVQLELRALNVQGQPTVNYRNVFAKLANFSDLNFRAIAEVLNANNTNLSSRLANDSVPATYQNLWGDLTGGELALSGDLIFTRANPADPDGPYEDIVIAFVPIDSDGVTLDAGDLNAEITNMSPEFYQLGTQDFRYGRLIINNAYGPETEDLAITFRVEYYDSVGGRFVASVDDNCTVINASQLSFVPNTYTGDLTDGDTSIVAPLSSTFHQGQIQGVQSAVTPTDPTFTLTAPGEGNSGTVDIELNLDALNLPYLRFKWPHEDNDYDEYPRAQVEFGQFRSHDRVINWQEIYNGATP